MKFTTQKDIEAPQDYVFGAVSDFALFERQALRRGLDVSRTTDAATVGAGTAWNVNASFQNRTWPIAAKVTKFDAPSGYLIEGKTDGVDIHFTADLLALSRHTTRLTVTVDFLPRTMTTRLLMQSLKLVRGRIQGKIARQIAAYATDIEKKFSATS